MPQITNGVLSLALVATLMACGGGSDPVPDTGSDSQSVGGLLVIPKSLAATSAAVLRSADMKTSGQRLFAQAFPGCPDVPDGYEPLASLALQFTNDAGTVLSTLTTDSCGGFTGNVSRLATRAVAKPTNASPISQPVSSLVTVAGAPKPVVSTLPTDADYVIGVVQDLGSAKVALTVSDSKTGKAVLGLTTSDFSFTVGANPVGLSSLSYGASQAQSNASVALVLDSSGSMTDLVGTTTRSRYQFAALAAHELLDGLTSGKDEAVVTLFSSRVFKIDDSELAKLKWVDPAGAAITAPNVSASGRTQNMTALRPVIDAYNRDSKIYVGASPTADAVHPNTGNLRIDQGYPYSGGTAFYDAVISGVEQLKSTVNSRKIVVAMTDGMDNASRSKLSDVVEAAKAQAIPVFAVAFGGANEVDETSMKSIANDTGGQYQRIESGDLTGLFQGIQTGIKFQYVASLASQLTSGVTLNITLKRGAAPVTRTLPIK